MKFYPFNSATEGLSIPIEFADPNGWQGTTQALKFSKAPNFVQFHKDVEGWVSAEVRGVSGEQRWMIGRVVE
jgi:hypothetical protein